MPLYWALNDIVNLYCNNNRKRFFFFFFCCFWNENIGNGHLHCSGNAFNGFIYFGKRDWLKWEIVKVLDFILKSCKKNDFWFCFSVSHHYKRNIYFLQSIRIRFISNIFRNSDCYKWFVFFFLLILNAWCYEMERIPIW